MDARLLDLDLTLTQLAVDSGVHLDTIRTWRAGTGTRRPSAKKTRQVEERLWWEHGSIQATLDGGEATALDIPEAAAGMSASTNPVARIRSYDLLTREEQDLAISQVNAAIARAADKQQRREDRSRGA